MNGGLVNKSLNKVVRVLTRPRTLKDKTSPHLSANPDGSIPATTPTGVLQSPWRRVKRQFEPETIYLLARRNYKVFADIGVTRRHMRRYVTILDTGAGSSYVRKDILPDKIMSFIRPLRTTINVRDAGNKRVAIAGTIDLTVQLGTCLLYTSPSPRDQRGSRMPSSA